MVDKRFTALGNADEVSIIVGGGIVLDLGADEIVYLSRVLDRLLAWDGRAAVRLETRESHLAVYLAPPTETLVVVAVPMRAPVEAGDFDITVSANRLKTALDDARGGVIVPSPVPGNPTLALLPPKTGWLRFEAGLAGDVRRVVDAAVLEFRTRTSPLSGGMDDPETAGEDIWARKSWGALPVRALHTASLFGMLNHDRAQVASYTNGPWKRLSTPAGQVIVRGNDGLARLSLAVVR